MFVLIGGDIMWTFLGIAIVVVVFLVIQYRTYFLEYLYVGDVLLGGVIGLIMLVFGILTFVAGIIENSPFILLGILLIILGIMNIISVTEEKGVFAKRRWIK